MSQAVPPPDHISPETPEFETPESETPVSRQSLAFPRRCLREIRAAILFLTRLPVGWPGPFPDDMQRRCQLWFPLVGGLIGGVGALVLLFGVWVGLPPAAVALIVITAQIGLTGALHEDGLADMADGFGGGATRDRKLEIMRDSRVGTYGALALVLSIGLRGVALAALMAVPANPALAAGALIALGAASRGAILIIPTVLTSARRDGVAAKTGAESTGRTAAANLMAVALVIVCLPPAGAFAAVAAVAVGTAVVALIAYRQVGGYTGDVLGAGQQIAEISGLLALVLILG